MESLIIGLVPAFQNHLDPNPIAQTLQGYALICNSGRRNRVRYKGIPKPFCGERLIQSGDVVGVVWDSDEGRLGYYHNNRFL
eukprot:895683-Amorphochlora_amoeboformis.AAC.1